MISLNCIWSSTYLIFNAPVINFVMPYTTPEDF